jgi:hypothetical protein
MKRLEDWVKSLLMSATRGSAAQQDEANALQRRLPNDALKIMVRGADEENKAG